MKVRRVDFYPDDWIAGVRGLSNMERGVYWDLCALEYSNGGPIERNDKELARYCRLKLNVFLRVMERLEAEGKWSQSGTKVECKRCESELNRARNRSEKASNSATKRWKTNKTQDADAMPTSKANIQQTTYNKQQEREHRLATPNGELSSRSEAGANFIDVCKRCGRAHPTLAEFNEAHPLPASINVLKAPEPQ